MFVIGIVVFCSIPAHAAKQKEFDKYDPPTDLVLTLPDPLLNTKKADLSTDQMPANYNAAQTSALKITPVNVDCNVDVIQNTLGDVSLSNRIYGKCGLHYQY